MQILFSNTSQPRHTHLKDQAFDAGLLGRFADKTAHGHWESKSKVGI